MTRNNRIQYLLHYSLMGLLLTTIACSNASDNQTAGTDQVAQAPADSSVRVERAAFGRLADGTAAEVFTLTNANQVTVKITNYGGTVISINVPDKEGKLEDVVLGFDSLAGYRSDVYLQEGPYFGALIGRYGNRIAGGTFKLDGQQYTLAKNNGPNHLHGGLKGFDKVMWEAEQFESAAGAGVKLQYESADGEEGYPGKLTVAVTYTLTHENELQIAYTATTDKKTVLNLTNHSYFNLTGNAKRDILDHQLMIDANTFLPVDETLIPVGEQRTVAGTPFDFREPTAIGQRINAQDQQLTFGKGYDHCWVLNGNAGEMRRVATVHEPVSGRFMEVFTTEPAIQFYSGNFLKGNLTGKGNVAYQQRWGLCLETQHFPDAPNQSAFPATELNPGETYQTQTTYKFSVK